MSLNIYEEPAPSTVFSADSTFSNALSLTVDGVIGAVRNTRYYIRNDDNTKFFTDIVLSAVVLSGIDIVSGATNGFVWKLIAGDTQPVEDQWGLTAAGNSISLSDIGSSGNADTSTFLPFWLRIEVPRGSPVTSHQNIGLQITATDNIA